MAIILWLFLIVATAFADISHITGFESNSAEFESTYNADVGNVTISSSVKRSGSYSARYSTAGIVAGYTAISSRAAGGTYRNMAMSARLYIRIDALPTNTVWLYQSFDSTIATYNCGIQLLTGGAVKLATNGATAPNSSTETFTADSQWHRIEFDAGYNSGAGARVYVDGTLWSSATITTGACTPQAVAVLGSITGMYDADIYMDDVLIDNQSYAVSGLPGAGSVALLVPTAGNNVNSWTGGGGGTGGIYVGVDNIPPTGAATPADASQIKNAASGGNLEYTATLQTYTVGGVSGVLKGAMAIVNDAEELGTNTKAGVVRITGNIAQSQIQGNTFDYGNDIGAQGNFPSNWRTHASTVSMGPAVVFGTAPTVMVSKTTSTTRVVDVDFMGMYVDYDPDATSARLEYLQSATDTTDQTTYTFSSQNIGAADSSRYIIVGIYSRDDVNGLSISSVTIGGVSASIAVQVSRDDSSNSHAVGLAVANVPTGTTGDVVVTLSGSALRCGISVYRTIGIDPTPYATDTEVTNTPTLSLNVVPGFAIAVMGNSNNGSSVTYWGTVNEDYDAAIGAESSAMSTASRNFTTTFTPLSITPSISSASSTVSAAASWRLQSGTTTLQDVLMRGIIATPR